MDGQIYGYYAKLLEPYYEALLQQYNLQNNVTAFRKLKVANTKVGKCNIHFAQDVFDFIRQKRNCVVLCYDISSFFDNLNHEILKQTWCDVLGVTRLPTDHFKVYQSLTQFAYVDKNALYHALGLSLHSRTLHRRQSSLCSIEEFHQKVRQGKLIKKNLKPKGIPQGSPISGILSNIYMLKFDHAMQQLVGKNGRYFRYCDDMIFVIDASDEASVRQQIEQAIVELKLTINPNKTQRVKFVDGKVQVPVEGVSFNHPAKLQYLGLTFDGENVFLRDAGLSKFHKKMRLAIRMHSKRFKKLKDTGKLRDQHMYRKALNERFSYVGKNNYLSYAFRVAKVHDAKTVKQQVRGHWGEMENYLQKNLANNN